MGRAISGTLIPGSGRLQEMCVRLWKGRSFWTDPRWERNLNTGESTLESSRTEVAHQTIFHDAEQGNTNRNRKVEG
jgi:hypothetical protein